MLSTSRFRPEWTGASLFWCRRCLVGLSLVAVSASRFSDAELSERGMTPVHQADCISLFISVAAVCGCLFAGITLSIDEKITESSRTKFKGENGSIVEPRGAPEVR